MCFHLISSSLAICMLIQPFETRFTAQSDVIHEGTRCIFFVEINLHTKSVLTTVNSRRATVKVYRVYRLCTLSAFDPCANIVLRPPSSTPRLSSLTTPCRSAFVYRILHYSSVRPSVVRRTPIRLALVGMRPVIRSPYVET